MELNSRLPFTKDSRSRSRVMQKLDVQIAPVQQQDYSQWLPYWLAYQDFYKVCLSNTVTKTAWQRFFDEAEPVYCAIAKQGEKVV